MSTDSVDALSSLYLEDETAWLEEMARLIAEERFAELDFVNLRDFLNDMARRDKREVLSRLTVLIAYLLKWTYQPEERHSSWRATIAEQRRELEDLLESAVLRAYAEEVVPKAFGRAMEQAALETGLPQGTFAAEARTSLEQWLTRETSK